ncbi:MAG TPA: FAD/NAD(P)-binding oxidoreductase [Steroidobacteraceae bacterium]
MIDRRRCLALTAAAVAVGASGTVLAGPRRRSPRPSLRARVLVIGAGFAGSACALRLRQLEPSIEVMLLDPVERYVTCPMSNEVIAGLREFSSLLVSDTGVRAAGIARVHERALGLDASGTRVRLEHGRTLSFDRLVVAPGIRFLSDRIEGYDPAATRRMPHAWQAGEQTRLLAQQLRAMSDGGVVAICVPSGLMRCPPAPFERASLIASYLSQHKPRSKILIFDGNNHFPRQDVFSAAWQALHPGMIEWIPSTEGGEVRRVDSASMTLYAGNGAHAVAVANVIPPQAPAALALDLGLASGHGWCPINPASFQSTLLDHVHVIGDACIADAMPKSASAGVSQAQQCAAALVALLSDRAIPAPAFDSVCYSHLSRDRAVSIPGQFGLRDGQIVSTAAPSTPEQVAAAAQPDTQATESQRAEDWYRTIRGAAFGA